MAKFKNKYRIESNRMRYWDYSSAGRYFITICVQNRECIFGEIENDKMILSEYGEIAKNEIAKMNQYHIRVIIDEWVVMPNHIHLLIELTDIGVDLVDDDGHVEKIHEFSLPLQQHWWRNPNYDPTIDEIKQYRKQRRRMLIPKILGKYQQQTSKQINILRSTPGMKNWQENYYDHIIRDDASYQRIKNYIIQNPSNWDEDTFNV